MKYAIAARTTIAPSATSSASVLLMLPPALLVVVTTGAIVWACVCVGAEDWGRPKPNALWAALDGESAAAANAAAGDSEREADPQDQRKRGTAE